MSLIIECPYCHANPDLDGGKICCPALDQDFIDYSKGKPRFGNVFAEWIHSHQSFLKFRNAIRSQLNHSGAAHP